ncbi:hypothetical protein Dimus_008723 [Dionaea muscipula]
MAYPAGGFDNDELNNAGIDRISPESGLIGARMAWVTGAIGLVEVGGCRQCADPWWHLLPPCRRFDKQMTQKL